MFPGAGVHACVTPIAPCYRPEDLFFFSATGRPGHHSLADLGVTILPQSQQAVFLFLGEVEGIVCCRAITCLGCSQAGRSKPDWLQREP